MADFGRKCALWGFTQTGVGLVSLQGVAAVQQPAVGEAPAGHQGLPKLRYPGAVPMGEGLLCSMGPGHIWWSSPSLFPRPEWVWGLTAFSCFPSWWPAWRR